MTHWSSNLEFTTDDFRRAIAPIDNTASPTQRRKANAHFRAELASYINTGHVCDLADSAALCNGALQGFDRAVQMIAAPHLFAGSVPPPTQPPDYSPDAPAPELHNGTCYLACVVPGARQRFLDKLGEFPLAHDWFEALLDDTGAWAPGFFQVKLGTKAGVARNVKFFAHIEAVPATHSLLRVRDLLHCIPGHFELGQDEVVPPAPAAPPLRPAPVATALGHVYDGRIRRITWRQGSIRFDAAHAGTHRVLHCVPGASQRVLEFSKFFSTARFDALAFHLRPASVYAGHVVTLTHWAWMPNIEAAATTRNDLWLKPQNDSRTLAPAFPLGAAPELSCNCAFDYDVQAAFKPVPHFGGSPAFSLLYCYNVLTLPDGTAATVPANAELYDILIEAVVHVE